MADQIVDPFAAPVATEATATESTPATANGEKYRKVLKATNAVELENAFKTMLGDAANEGKTFVGMQPSERSRSGLGDEFLKVNANGTRSVAYQTVTFSIIPGKYQAIGNGSDKALYKDNIYASTRLEVLSKNPTGQGPEIKGTIDIEPAKGVSLTKIANIESYTFTGKVVLNEYVSRGTKRFDAMAIDVVMLNADGTTRAIPLAEGIPAAEQR